MELADLIIVNKADGDLLPSAMRAESAFSNSLQLVPTKSPLWKPPVVLCSASNLTNIDTAWNLMKKYWDIMLKSGELSIKREEQQQQRMWKILEDELMKRFLEKRVREEIFAFSRATSA